MGYEKICFPEDSLFLVTGGAGFIGSNLCEAILKLGYRVRCLDDLSTGKRENVELFAEDPRYEFVLGDIKDLDSCLRACEGVDFVLNQAAWGSVPRSIEMPLFYCANNISGTLNMLEAARQSGVKKFVYASSSSVYGDEPNLPKREGREGNLLSPYAVSKRCDEEWAKQYTLHYGLDTYGLRYFNVFGRRQDPNGAYAAVIPRFLRQLLHGEVPTINGDGRQSRDFTYIENVIEANLKACLAPHEAAGQAYNIAYGGREYRRAGPGPGAELRPRPSRRHQTQQRGYQQGPRAVGLRPGLELRPGHRSGHCLVSGESLTLCPSLGAFAMNPNGRKETIHAKKT